MYNDEGESVWEQELDMYGNVRKFANKDYVHLPFRYQGQYYDKEIDLCYNRFRYYDTELGRYISEDPIGFLSGEFNFYNYVDDPNGWIDIFGLAGYSAKDKADLLRQMKDGPPKHPDYKPPKKGNGRTKKGWKDKNGKVWEPTDHKGTHNPHWDVQDEKGGGYTNVYPEVTYTE